jgi:O-antigen/teichoic acid export membrane protein
MVYPMRRPRRPYAVTWRIPSAIRKLLSDTALVSFGKYGQFLVTFAVTPILAHYLRLEGIAAYATASSAALFGSIVVDGGLTQVLAVEVASGRGTSAYKRAYFAARILCFAGLALPSILVGALFGWSSWGGLIAAGLLIGGCSSMGEDWVLIGRSAYGRLALAQVLSRLANLGGLLLMLALMPTIATALFVLAVSNLIFCALTWLFAQSRPAGVLGFENKTADSIEAVRVWSLLSKALRLIPSRIAATLGGQLPVLFFSAIAPAAVFGAFAAADKVVKAAQSALDALSTALLPRLARGRERTDFGALALRALGAASVGGLLIAVGCTVLAPWIVDILFGRAFEASVGALRVEIWTLCSGAVVSVGCNAILYVAHDTKGIWLVSGLSLPTAVISIAIFYSAGTSVAIAASVLLASIASAAVTWLRVRFILKALKIPEVQGDLA